MLIDIHTHHPIVDGNIIQIVNVSIEHELPLTPFYCMGIHPWSLNNSSNLEKDIQILENSLLKSDAVAMGEMGLDRAIETSFDLQVQYFLAQLDLATKLHKDVVVIHCVKAYSDLIACLKNSSFKGTLILHDYNGNQQETQELLKGNFYFSYSRALFNPQMKGHKSLEFIPLNKLFLETDDQKEKTLFEHYQELARVKNISVNDLEVQLEKNFKEIFKDTITSLA